MRMHNGTLAALLLCGSVLAGHVNAPVNDWKELREKNLRMGCSAEQVDRPIDACRANGLSVMDAEDLLCAVYTAHEAELPTDCLFIRIEEGLAKHAAWEDVHAAANRRLECMLKADELILSVRQHRGGEHQHLVKHMCLAMESGLPEDVLKNVINRPSRFRYGRLIHVTEAGESLHLAGFDPAQIQHIMNDCLDRDLSYAEVMRVVDVLQRGLHEGKDFETLHDTLWVSSATADTGR